MADGWTIDSQRMTKQLTGAGTFRDVWEIRFVTTNGTHGMIDVDVRNYNPEFVRSAIDSYVEQINAVENL